MRKNSKKYDDWVTLNWILRKRKYSLSKDSKLKIEKQIKKLEIFLFKKSKKAKHRKSR